MPHTNDPYINWYFARKPHTFFSMEEMIATVGTRPGSEWTLTRTTREQGTPLSPNNFLWVTKNSLDLAKEGELSPPRFPSTANRSVEAQAVNNSRFTFYTHATIEWARGAHERAEQRAELNKDLTLLLSQITDYVVSKGYSELEAMNPDVLSDKPKLAAARQKATHLMAVLSGNRTKRRTLHESVRIKREKTKLLNHHNRVYANKRGRPIERWIRIRVAVSSLTQAQRAQYNQENADQPQIPLTGPIDHVYAHNPDLGRLTKRSTVFITVLNPKLATSTENPGTTGQLSSDTRA